MGASGFWLNGKKEKGVPGAEHMDNAIAAMHAGAGKLRSVSKDRRARWCRAVRDGVERRAEDLARCIATEARKPIRAARAEVGRAISTFGFSEEEARREWSERVEVERDPRGMGYECVVERVAGGPAGFVTPFNFPLNLVAHKGGPAMASGCGFVVKPSERTPKSALMLGEILADAGLPEGSWHILPCEREVSLQLVRDERIKLFSFTGSAEVGWKLKGMAGKKKVLLELGGNAAVVVAEDADVGDAVKRIVAGAFGYSGQSCISVQRIYVHETIADEVIAKLLDETKKLVMGDPLDEQTDVGPVIDEAAAERLEQWIAGSGGRVLCGGGRKGAMVEPTLVLAARSVSMLVREEAFGPVAVIDTYGDFEEVLARVDGSRYGLQAAIFTKDEGQVQRAFERLEVGALVVNDVPTTRFENMPYGGVKDSGLGREGVRYAMEEMLERKVLLRRV